MAIIGGAFIADLTLGIPFFTFLSRIQEVVPIHDLWVGLIKAPVFGLIVGIAGTYQGMQVEGEFRAGRPADHHGRGAGHLHGDRARRILCRFLHGGRLGMNAKSVTHNEPKVVHRVEHLARLQEHDLYRGDYPIVVEGLSNSFGEHVIHEDLSLKVRRGEIFGVVGGSGTGKSVLMRSIIGLQTPTEGTIEVFGRSMADHHEAAEIDIRSRWGVLFQGGALFSTLTVGENVEVPLREFYPEIDRRTAQGNRRVSRCGSPACR